MNTEMNTEMNTPTPRTDAKVVICNYGKERVTADFARTLERELAESRNAERLARVQLGNERARLDWLASPQGRLWQRQNESALVCRDTIDAMKEGK
jgi:hypothetical protein